MPAFLFHVHERTGNSLHGNHLLPDHVWFFLLLYLWGLLMKKIFPVCRTDEETTMFCMMSGCILNIILDPIMIFGLLGVPGWESRGAAWATSVLDSCLRWQRICFSHGSVSAGK